MQFSSKWRLPLIARGPEGLCFLMISPVEFRPILQLLKTTAYVISQWDVEPLHFEWDAKTAPRPTMGRVL